MELLVTSGNKKASKVDVSDEAFAYKFNETLVHQVVTAYLAGGRAGTKAQKNRSDVRGGASKPWRQKGTGRARAGTIRSPLWRTGGVTFAARPRCFAQKINKKMYQSAMRSIVSELLRQERLQVIDELTLTQPKTRELVAKLSELQLSNVLIITAEQDHNLSLAARNLPNAKVIQASTVDPVSLVAAEKLLITVDALKKLEARLVS